MISLLSAWGTLTPEIQKTPNIGDRYIEDAIVWHLRDTGGLTDEEFPVFPSRVYLRRRELAVINRSRALILCGANMLHRTFWPGYIKLTRRLSRIRAPIISFGLGWGGERPRERYNFRPESRIAIRRIAGDFPVFSVRDSTTRDLLEDQVPETRGRVQVTGCPVLFRHNRGRFDAASMTGGGQSFLPQRILFSSNERLLLEEHVHLFQRLRQVYPHAKITVVLNQASDLFTSLVDLAGAEVVHSNRPQEYYDLFERHDFQIGFRLHNHLSFLSLSKPSLTVETDGRTKSFAATFDCVNLPPGEASTVDHARVVGLLQRNTERLLATTPPCWDRMRETIRQIAALPKPKPPGLLARLWGG